MLLADSPAEQPKWTDVWSAYGTVGAAAFAVLAVGVTIWLAHRDRKNSERLRQQDAAAAAAQRAEDLARATQDRLEADQRLRDERVDADRRLREEREDRDRRQARDSQIAAARALLNRLASFHVNQDMLLWPSSKNVEDWSLRLRAERSVIDDLRAGAYSEALALGSPQGLALYRNLVSLVVSVRDTLGRYVDEAEMGGDELQDVADAIAPNLRRYARYVRLWISQIVESGTIPDDAVGPDGMPADMPILGDFSPVWTPRILPPGWTEDVATDPNDPQFAPRP